MPTDFARNLTEQRHRSKLSQKAAAEALEVPCIPVDGLREMDLGEWEGQNWDDIRASYGEVYTYWNEHRRYTHTPGGESYQEVVDRTLAALEEIIQQETGDVLVVTHSAVIMALRCYLEELPFEEMVRRFKAKNTEIIEISSEEIENAIQRFHRGE